MPARAVVARQADKRRGSARQRGYDGRWEKARLGHLANHPLCVCCEASGAVVAADVVDHVEPHKGDWKKFWNRDEWQSLCAWCHNNVKSKVEAAVAAGRMPGQMLRLDRLVDGWVHPRAR